MLPSAPDAIKKSGWFRCIARLTAASVLLRNLEKGLQFVIATGRDINLGAMFNIVPTNKINGYWIVPTRDMHVSSLAVL